MNGEKRGWGCGSTARAKSIAHLPACEMPYAKSFPSGLRTPCAYYQLPCIHCDTLFYTFHSHHYVLVHEIDEPAKASVIQIGKVWPTSLPIRSRCSRPAEVYSLPAYRPPLCPLSPIEFGTFTKYCAPGILSQSIDLSCLWSSAIPHRRMS